MSLKKVTLSNGQSLFVRVLKGQVIQQQRHKFTEINQGNAIVGPDYVIPGKIYSNTVTEQEVWLRFPAGEEHMFDISQFDIPALQGHQMVITEAKLGSGGRWRMTRVQNLSTGRYQEKTPFTKDDILQAGRGKQFLAMTFFGGPLLGFLVGGVASFFMVPCNPFLENVKGVVGCGDFSTSYWGSVGLFMLGFTFVGLLAGLFGPTKLGEKSGQELAAAIHASE